MSTPKTKSQTGRVVIVSHPDGRIEGLEEARAAILANPAAKERMGYFVKQCQNLAPQAAAPSATVPSEAELPLSVPAAKPASSAPCVTPKKKPGRPRKAAPKSTIPAAIAA